ncbi:hypothetical protein [Thiothrix sp.]|jgi:fido (protein-threonine AMPylation protein)|uniref:hypothetical protein n=1 Tax=Thiothrix sp. TaxID=1032 RepID=UPI0025807160|nr:hypothetical protein [Thiothrix sp.]
MDTDDKDVRRKFVQFWEVFFQSSAQFRGALVSAHCFFDKVWQGTGLSPALTECDVKHLYPLDSRFPYRSAQGLAVSNCYSRTAVDSRDQFLSARFHALLPQIVAEYRDAFIDQLRCVHFLGMAGNEAMMLYPSQHKRLYAENVQSIAGEVRGIQAGFGDFRFNAPTPANLPPLLAVYANKVESLLQTVDETSIHCLVSFAQYYFALLHPFYERCGRTSEELMYLLFERVGFGWRYISATGDRSSSLAHERMTLINRAAEGFNRKIAGYFGLPSEGIRKTPDIYRAVTAKYFAPQYPGIYADELPRPFYYQHPQQEVIDAYHFLMESLLLDEIMGFSLQQPYPHIMRLGEHLREAGEQVYQGYAMPSAWGRELHSVLAGMAE